MSQTLTTAVVALTAPLALAACGQKSEPPAAAAAPAASKIAPRRGTKP